MLCMVSEFISPSFLSLRRILYSLSWIGIVGYIHDIIRYL